MTVLGVSATGGVDVSIDVAKRLLATKDMSAGDSQVFLGGYGAHREELVALSRSDLARAERVGVPIVFVVLLLTFGSLWATLVPLAIGLTAVLAGLGAAGALAFAVPFSEYVTNAATMVGLALAVDYAMFLVQRVRESVLGGMEIDDAIRAAMRTTGKAIAWSGLTVMVAEATMLLVDSRAIRTAGLGMILVTFAAIVAALAGAPIVIRLLGHRILRRSDRERLDAMGTSAATAAAEGADRFTARPRGFWASWGLRVTNRPILWLAGGAVLLTGMSMPALELSQRVDLPSASAMPANSQVRHAAEIGEKSYGPGVFTPIEVVVYATPEMVATEANRVADALSADPDVRSVRQMPLDRPGVYRLSIATVHGSADERTKALVMSLRGGELHRSLAGIRYDVGGETAMRIDATDALFASLPLMLGVILAVVCVLLIVAMRSIVIPLKAILLIVISLGASTGCLLLLSTTKLGAKLIGWSQPAELHPIVPVTIVAIVIALSTDYEVILIARIAERYRQTADNTASIVDGVAQTGRVISSAAAIMIAIFLGFALSDVTPLKQIGVGLALAVFIDATVVRGVLVPAAMQLMGRWNWWFPSAASDTAPTPSPDDAVASGRAPERPARCADRAVNGTHREVFG